MDKIFAVIHKAGLGGIFRGALEEFLGEIAAGILQGVQIINSGNQSNQTRLIK